MPLRFACRIPQVLKSVPTRQLEWFEGQNGWPWSGGGNGGARPCLDGGEVGDVREERSAGDAVGDDAPRDERRGTPQYGRHFAPRSVTKQRRIDAIT